MKERRMAAEQQHEWRHKTLAYRDAINQLIAERLRGSVASRVDFSVFSRNHLAKEALEAIENANVFGQTEQLRDEWPVDTSPLEKLLASDGVNLGTISRIESGFAVNLSDTSDDRVLLVSAAGYEWSSGTKIAGVKNGDSRVAIGTSESICIRDGWNGPILKRFRWPWVGELLPELTSWIGEHEVCSWQKVVPYADGQKLLLVGPLGVHLTDGTTFRRLVPNGGVVEDYAYCYHRDGLIEPFQLDSVHASVSPNHETIVAACEQQDQHLVFDGDGELRAQIAPVLDYPNLATFSESGHAVLLGSCYFSEGAALIASAAQGITAYNVLADAAARRVSVYEGSKIHAAASFRSQWIIGDRSGYLAGLSEQGIVNWIHYIGPSISDICVAQDGTHVAVSTRNGLVVILRLNSRNEPSAAIEVSPHSEICRWIVLRGRMPIRW